MRRKRQLLTRDECVEILEKMTFGTLALSGDDGYPYALPISYVYSDDKVYFHSALKGHKIDALMQNDKVSFCVVGQDFIVPEEYTTYFRSVIIFGRARIVEDEDEKRTALQKLGRKYSPDDAEGLQEEIEKGFTHLLMIELTIESMTGKESIELVRRKAEKNSSNR